MWLIAIFMVCLITTYGGMPAIWVAWARPISITGIAATIVYHYIKSQKEYKKKHATEIQRHRERPPVTPLRHNENLDSPQRRKELIKWNRDNPSRLVEGPCNETPALRSLRLSLLTPEQLATIPFGKRILIRNAHCHQSYFADSYRCIICGSDQYRDQKWCCQCGERYKQDLANGWHPKPEDRIKPGYEWVLWRLQQIVAKDLQMHIISEGTARAEMKEVVEVARQDIAEMERQEAERQTGIQRHRNQQSELSDIVKRLS